MKIANTEYTPVDLSETIGTKDPAPRIRITNKAVTFNSAFCDCMHCVPFIEIYINAQQRKVAFKGVEEKTAISRGFFPAKAKHKKDAYHSVTWNGKKIINAMVTIFDVKARPTNIEGTEKDGFIVFDIGKSK